MKVAGVKPAFSHQCCSWMSQLCVIARVFTYFHTSAAKIKWLPSGHLLIFSIWPLKPKMSRARLLRQCVTCRAERDGQMPNDNKKKKKWQLKIGLERIPRWCEKERSRSPWSPFSPQPRLSARVSSAGAPSILTARPQSDVFSVCKPSATMQITSNWCCQRRSIGSYSQCHIEYWHGRQPRELIGTVTLNLLLCYFLNLPF